MKKIINSRYFKWFRKGFLRKIYIDILHEDANFCCYVRSWHRIFICWKDLKEVKENMDSVYKDLDHKVCVAPWFSSKENRIKFIAECLIKLR